MKPCDLWRERLAEHALGSLGDPELADHLKKCRACSAALTEMESLTGAIDRGIRQLASSEPDANSAARILVQVGSRAEQTRWLPMGRALAAAFAAAVFLAASIGVLWKVRAQREDAERALSAAAGISSWKSPTRELLHSPYGGLLKSAPRLGKTFYQLDIGSLKVSNAAHRVKEKQNP
jgi:anti-sigma factor RsiW